MGAGNSKLGSSTYGITHQKVGVKVNNLMAEKKHKQNRKKVINTKDVFFTRDKKQKHSTYKLARKVGNSLGQPMQNFVERNEMNTSHVNYKVYHLLTEPSIFATAYAKISKNKGALSKGVPEDEEEMTWFGQMNCHRLADLFRTNSYIFKPVRRTMIPKPGKNKLRPIDTPTQRDRIVQEALRGLLEAVYEPVFQELEEKSGGKASNYGFRPTKSCMNAVQALKNYGQRCNYAIEGDIVGAYNNVNRQILIKIIERRIKDKKMLRLFRDLLDSQILFEGQVQNTLLGTPQGGIVSPILFNIYMFEFDMFVYETIVKPFNNAEQKPSRRSSLYQKQGYQMKKIRTKLEEVDKKSPESKELTKTLKKIQKERMSYLSYDVKTLPKRAVYTRYADDWVLLVTSTKKEAYSIKNVLSEFLNTHLELELDKEKTLVSHMTDTGINFLGFTIRMTSESSEKKTRVITKNKFSTSRTLRQTTSRKIRITPDKKRILANLKLRKFCQGEDLFPIGIRQWALMEPYRIVERYDSIMRGLASYYRECDNHYVLNRVSYILQYSCAKTIATRKKISMKAVFKKYGKNLKISYEKKGMRSNSGSHSSKTFTSCFLTYTDLKKSKWLDETPTPKQTPDPFRVQYYPRTISGSSICSGSPSGCNCSLGSQKVPKKVRNGKTPSLNGTTGGFIKIPPRDRKKIDEKNSR